MSQKIGSLFYEITAETGKFQKSLFDSKTKVGKLASGLNDVTEKLTGFNLAQLSAGVAIYKGVQFLRDSVNEYSAYVEAVDKASMFTGMQAEEMSRLIQTADDFRVSQEGLTNALRMGAQNGFEPTIENIIALADEYNAMQSPTEQAEMLQRKFGRSWAEIVPLLKRGGQAIRDSIEDIDASLVVTQEAIEANREYQLAVDEIADSWTGVKNEAARSLIPTLADVLKLSTETAEATDEMGLAWLRAIPGIGGIYQGIMLLTSGNRKAADGMDSELTPAVEDATGAIEDNAAAVEEAYGIYTGFNEATYTAYRGLTDTASAARDLSAAEDELKSALEGMQGAADNFLSSTANDLKQSLESRLPESSKKFNDALGVIDDVFGSTFLADAEKQKRIDDLSRKFANGQLDVDDYKQALIDMREEGLDTVVEGWKDAIIEARNYKEELLNIPTTITIDVFFNKHGDASVVYDSTAAGSTGNRRGGVQEGHANGGSFTIPAGYPNDSFYLGGGHWAQSGETVTVTPAGEKPGGNTYNWNIYTQKADLGSLLFGARVMQATEGL